MKESGEMYLETIYLIGREKTDVRAVDVAERMQYSKPSVSRAVSILRTDGYITVNAKGCLLLTEKGEKIAKTIMERHELFTEILLNLGVSRETAIRDACRIEHVISYESTQAIKKYMRDHHGREERESV